jgi:pilus assembly protein CpaF
VTRLSDGRRKVTGISEITGMETDVITTQEIFLFERTGIGEDSRVKGVFRATGIRPKCADRIQASGRALPAEMFEHVKAVA